MKRILNTMACVFLLCAATQAADKAVAPDDRFADSIVRIMATYQIYNPVLPWQKYNPRIQVGYGVVVDDTHVLTLETIVRSYRQTGVAPKAQFLIGWIHLFAQEPQKARAALQQVIKEYPNTEYATRAQRLLDGL